MAGITVKARVRRDGTLAIPKRVLESLELQEGDPVEITVDKPTVQALNPEDDPLLKLIGIGKGGPVDGAEDHDSRLYGRSSA